LFIVGTKTSRINAHIGTSRRIVSNEDLQYDCEKNSGLNTNYYPTRGWHSPWKEFTTENQFNAIHQTVRADAQYTRLTKSVRKNLKPNAFHFVTEYKELSKENIWHGGEEEGFFTSIDADNSSGKTKKSKKLETSSTELIKECSIGRAFQTIAKLEEGPNTVLLAIDARTIVEFEADLMNSAANANSGSVPVGETDLLVTKTGLNVSARLDTSSGSAFLRSASESEHCDLGYSGACGIYFGRPTSEGNNNSTSKTDIINGGVFPDSRTVLAANLKTILQHESMLRTLADRRLVGGFFRMSEIRKMFRENPQIASPVMMDWRTPMMHFVY